MTTSSDPDRPDPSDGGGSAAAGPSLEILGAAFGSFPEVSRLNPEFVAGWPRLKLTLKIDPRGLPPPRDLLAGLEGGFPTLSLHRCCGSGTLHSALCREDMREDRAASDGEQGLSVAHLLEHLIIDLQHHIGRMRICSGITCAYHRPPDRYDIFVESPEEKVGWLSASVAVGISSDLIAGHALDPHYLCIAETARCARDGAGKPVRDLVRSLEGAFRSEAISEAIDYLRLQGFLTLRPSAAGDDPDYIYEP